jgi:acetyl/propionyl-CoA carboxylase alpha subunit
LCGHHGALTPAERLAGLTDDGTFTPLDVVDEETVVGIVEAMKMMNKVVAGRSDTVAAVLARDGELVEYGQPLVALTAGW